MTMRNTARVLTVAAVLAGLAGVAGPTLAVTVDAPAMSRAGVSSETLPEGLTFTAVRSTTNCNVVTVTVVGMPATRKLHVTLGWDNDGMQYFGRGGVGRNWKHRYDARETYSGSFPRGTFEMTVAMWTHPDLALDGDQLIVSPCTRR